MKEALLKALKEQRFSLKDVAEWLGISYQSAWRKANGETEWSLSDIKTLKSHLGKKTVVDIFLN